MALKLDDFRADFNRSKAYVASRKDYKRSVRHRMTDKRIVVLYFVMQGTGSLVDPWLTLDELLKKLAEFGWPIDKKSIHFHIRPLIKAGDIERRALVTKGGKARRKLAGTAAGRYVLNNYRDMGKLDDVLSKEYRIGY